MPFEKGKPRPANAGRKKGTPNRKTIDLRELCEKEGVEPFEVLLRLCKARDEGIRLGAAKEASKYLYYQRRVQEISGPDGGPLQTEAQASSELQEIMAELKSVIDTKINERKG